MAPTASSPPWAADVAGRSGRSLGQHLARPFAAFGRYTAAAFGWRQVKAGAEDIRLLWDAVRGRRPEPGPAPISLDLRSHRVRVTLWQTAWAARVYAGTGALVWWAWVAEAALRGRTATPFTALLVLLVVAALALKAFLEALRNWQLRTGLPGGTAAFLAWEGGPLWPPLPSKPD